MSSSSSQYASDDELVLSYSEKIKITEDLTRLLQVKSINEYRVSFSLYYLQLKNVLVDPYLLQFGFQPFVEEILNELRLQSIIGPLDSSQISISDYELNRTFDDLSELQRKSVTLLKSCLYNILLDDPVRIFIFILIIIIFLKSSSLFFIYLVVV